MMPNLFKEQNTRNRRVDSVSVPTFGMQKMEKNRPSINLISNKNTQKAKTKHDKHNDDDQYAQNTSRCDRKVYDFPSPQSPRSNNLIFEEKKNGQNFRKTPEKNTPKIPYNINSPINNKGDKNINSSGMNDEDREENDISFLPVMKTAQNSKKNQNWNSQNNNFESKSATQSSWRGTFKKPIQQPSIMKKREINFSPSKNEKNNFPNFPNFQENEVNRYSRRSKSQVPSSIRKDRDRKSSEKKKNKKQILKLFEDNKYLSDQIVHLKDIISSLEGKVIELERDAQRYKEKFEIGEIEKQFFVKKCEDFEKNEEKFQTFFQKIDNKVSDTLNSHTYNNPYIEDSTASWACLQDIKVSQKSKKC